MLIDPRATHSFISTSLVDLLGLLTSLLQFDMLVSTPIGKSFLATRVVKNYSIVIGGRELLVDLILLKLHDFDIILGPFIFLDNLNFILRGVLAMPLFD